MRRPTTIAYQMSLRSTGFTVPCIDTVQARGGGSD